MYNLPPTFRKLFDPLRFFSKRITHYQLFSLQKHTSNTIKTFEASVSVTTEPCDERNFSPGFIQLWTLARINICSTTQQPPGTKLETIWHRRAIKNDQAKQSNSTRHVIN